MRTWTLRALVALIAVGVAASAIRAASPEPPVATDETLKLILIQLQNLTAQMNAMQTTQDGTKKAMQDDIDRLKNDVARLNDEVRRLSKTTTSIAASINPEAPVSPTPPSLPLTGAVVVDNQTASLATIYINGQPYTVTPFAQTRINGVPARFTYSVSTAEYGQIQASTTRSLFAGRDFPIVIHP